MCTVYIDTSSNVQVVIGVFVDGKKYMVEEPLLTRKAQVVLPILSRLLREHEMTISDIDAIEVHQGPGSFTGVRVGVTIANALSFALGVPINGKKDLIEPRYL